MTWCPAAHCHETPTFWDIVFALLMWTVHAAKDLRLQLGWPAGIQNKNPSIWHTPPPVIHRRAKWSSMFHCRRRRVRPTVCYEPAARCHTHCRGWGGRGGQAAGPAPLHSPGGRPEQQLRPGSTLAGLSGAAWPRGDGWQPYWYDLTTYISYISWTSFSNKTDRKFPHTPAPLLPTAICWETGEKEWASRIFRPQSFLCKIHIL